MRPALIGLGTLEGPMSDLSEGVPLRIEITLLNSDLLVIATQSIGLYTTASTSLFLIGGLGVH